MSSIVYPLSNVIDFTRLNDEEYLSSMNLKKHSKSDSYYILKYEDKKYLNALNYSTLGLFRSIVVKDGKVVSFAPPKSVPLDMLKDEEPLRFEPYVEGTMVNLYFDGVEWELATRSSIGAKTNFYKGSKSFRYQFLDAMNSCGFQFDDLDKSLVYSFVVQHPENRIVVPVKEPTLYLCAVYKVLENNDVEEIPLTQTTIEDTNKKLIILEPYNDIDTIEQAKDVYSNQETTPFSVMGVVVRQGNLRSKLRNPNYEYVRQMRGNQPKSQYVYLNLRKNGMVREFLKYYPEYVKEFARYREQLHVFTYNLHSNYVACFVKKMLPIEKFGYEFRPHMYALHEKYIHELMSKKECVTHAVVMSYVNDLDVARQMFMLNYKLRQLKKNIQEPQVSFSDEKEVITTPPTDVKE